MIAPTLRQNLLTIVAAYAKARNVSLSTVSGRFYGKSIFLRDFKARRCSISIDQYDKFITAIQADWPDDTPWPYLRPAIINRT